MMIPKFKVGDTVVNNSTFWHGGIDGRYNDDITEIGLEGKITEVCGLFSSYDEKGQIKTFVYLIEWATGGKCTKAEHQVKADYKTLIRWRNDVIKKILNEN